MSEAKQVDVLLARNKLCLILAEQLEPEIGEGYDVEEAYQIIKMYLPLSYAEGQAEMDAMKAEWDADPRPFKPSKFAQLREALHCTDGMSINCVLNAALVKIEQRDDLLAACEAAMRIVEMWCPAVPRSRREDNAEYQALHSMRKKFRTAIAKARGEN